MDTLSQNQNDVSKIDSGKDLPSLRFSSLPEGVVKKRISILKEQALSGVLTENDLIRFKQFLGDIESEYVFVIKVLEKYVTHSTKLLSKHGMDIAPTGSLFVFPHTEIFKLNALVPTVQLPVENMFFAPTTVFELTAHSVNISAPARIFAEYSHIDLIYYSPFVDTSIIVNNTVDNFDLISHPALAKGKTRVLPDVSEFNLESWFVDVKTVTGFDVPTSSFTLTGLSPDIIVEVNVPVAASSFSLNSLVVSVDTSITVNTPVDALLLEGLQPIVNTFVAAPVSTSAFTLTSLPGTVDTSIIVSVAEASFGLVGLQPTVPTSVATVAEAPLATFALFDESPIVDTKINVSVPAVNFALSGSAPSVDTSVVVSVVVDALGLTGHPPTVVVPDAPPSIDTTHPMAVDIAVYLEFYEGSGAVVNDISNVGDPDNMALISGVEKWTTRGGLPVLHIDTSADAWQVPHSTEIDTINGSDLTIMMRFALSVDSPGSDAYLFSKGYPDGWSVDKAGDNGDGWFVYMESSFPESFTSSILNSDTTINTLMLSYNNAANEISVYVNGSLVTTLTPDDNAALSALVPITIGDTGSPSTYDLYINKWALWHRALSAQEASDYHNNPGLMLESQSTATIALAPVDSFTLQGLSPSVSAATLVSVSTDNFNFVGYAPTAGVPSSAPTLNTGHSMAVDLKLYHDFYEEIGTIINDLVGANDITMTGGRWETMAGEPVYDLDSGSGTEHGAVANDASWNIPNGTDFTVLYRFAYTGSGFDRNSILSAGDGFAGWMIQQTDWNSNIDITMANVVNTIDGSSLIDGTLNTLMLVYTQATQETLVYINGTLAATLDFTSSEPMATSEGLEIGDPTTGSFELKISKIGIWHRALSAQEASDYHNNPDIMLN